MKVSDRFEERAITCCNLGILYAGMDQDDEALRAYKMAKSSYEACPEEGRVHYGAVLNGLGSLYTKKGSMTLLFVTLKTQQIGSNAFSEKMRNMALPFKIRGTLYEKNGGNAKRQPPAALWQALFTKLYGAKITVR